jgi:hypothetical protein
MHPAYTPPGIDIPFGDFDDFHHSKYEIIWEGESAVNADGYTMSIPRDLDLVHQCSFWPREVLFKHHYVDTVPPVFDHAMRYLRCHYCGSKISKYKGLNQTVNSSQIRKDAAIHVFLKEDDDTTPVIEFTCTACTLEHKRFMIKACNVYGCGNITWNKFQRVSEPERCNDVQRNKTKSARSTVFK